MKILVKGQTLEQKTEPEMHVFLRPVLGEHVEVCATDATGHSYIIASIERDGIRLFAFLPKATGWPLDEHGRIALMPDGSF